MDLQLKDQIALVTGASSGLGLACAQALLEEGASVCVSSSDEQRSAEAAARLGEGDRVAHTVLDLLQPDHPEKAVAAVAEQFGSAPTILVMSTGGPPAGTFATTDDEAWERALDLVLRGAIRTIRAALPGMRAASTGRIVVLTSIAAQEPIDGLLTSSTTRAGVHGLINALAREVGPEGITVNAVMPGYTGTDRLLELTERWGKERGTSSDAVVEQLAANIPIRRIVDPAELGGTVAFLCSRQAAAINGIALPVDGGELRSI